MCAKVVRLGLVSAQQEAAVLMAHWFDLQCQGKSAKIAGLWGWRSDVESFCRRFDGDRVGCALLLLDWYEIQLSLSGEDKYQALDMWRARALGYRAGDVI